MPSTPDPASADVGPRTIYRGKAPERKPLRWLGLGLIGVCLIGLVMRGPEPSILAILVLSPLAVFAYSLFERWARRRIRQVDLEGSDLVLRPDFASARRVPLDSVGEWAVEEIALYSTGASYDANQAVQIDTGAEVTGPALVAVETATGQRIELVVEGARIDLNAFRGFAPAVVTELEQRKNGKGKSGISFKPM